MSNVRPEWAIRIGGASLIDPHTQENVARRLKPTVWDFGLVPVAQVVEHEIWAIDSFHFPRKRARLLRLKSVLPVLGDVLAANVTRAHIERLVDELCAKRPKPEGPDAIRFRNRMAVSCASLLLILLERRCALVAPRLAPIVEAIKARRRADRLTSATIPPKQLTTVDRREFRTAPANKKSGGR